MSFFETVTDGFTDLVSDLAEWNTKRKWVTDQEQARIERAEIEAREEAEREAFSEFLDEHKENVTQEEKERLKKHYRAEQSNERTHPLLGDGEFEPQSPFQDQDFEPEWPLAESDEDQERSW